MSATIGDTDAAAAWLGAGSGRSTYVPELPREKLRWRLGIEHFYIESPAHDDSDPKHTGPSVIYDLNFGNIKKEIKIFSRDVVGAVPYQEQQTSPILPDVTGGESEKEFDPAADPGYEYIYDATKGRKSLVFSNSREETEYVTATLRQIAERRGERDVFLIHHGNLSAAIREEALEEALNRVAEIL